MSIGLPKDSPFADDDSATDATGPPSLDGAGILIVDEDPAFQLGLKTFVRDYVGFESVFTAGNGREALEMLQAEPSIEVITLDYRMPEMGGIAFLEALRENAPRPLSVIMITGYPSDHLEEQFRSYGSSLIRTEHFLSKPVTFDKLEPILLRSYRSLKTLPTSSPAPISAMTEDTPTQTEVGGAGSSAIDEAAETETTRDREGENAEASGLESLVKKIDGLEEKVDRIGRKTPSRFGRFVMDLFKLVILLALILAAWKTGLIDRFLEWIDTLDLGIGSVEGNGDGDGPI